MILRGRVAMSETKIKIIKKEITIAMKSKTNLSFITVR